MQWIHMSKSEHKRECERFWKEEAASFVLFSHQFREREREREEDKKLGAGKQWEIILSNADGSM